MKQIVFSLMFVFSAATASADVPVCETKEVRGEVVDQLGQKRQVIRGEIAKANYDLIAGRESGVTQQYFGDQVVFNAREKFLVGMNCMKYQEAVIVRGQSVAKDCAVYFCEIGL